jgi:poly(3-hydroxybutyrate) depolymerase
MRARLLSPAADIVIANRDLTVPDVLSGRESDILLGVPLVNTTSTSRVVWVLCDSGGTQTKSGPFTLPMCTLTKVPIRAKATPAATAKDLIVHVSVMDGEKIVASQDVSLAVRAPSATHKQTYASRVDGSTQYLSIVPPTDDSTAPALVMSLHGAGVEASSQAGSYAARPGMVIICPTNRRPFGFDWEEWGRIDAIECMDLAKQWYKTDSTRQYLTGHSMGGHGTWNIGVLYPERFAAIAPSAGWLSFDSYVGAGGPPHSPDTKLGQAFAAARVASLTLNYFANLKGKGIFILHGDADDNVPVGQARAARVALDKLGIAYGFHEQPGAGHWWDDDKPGAACLDWPAIWETFAQHKIDGEGTTAVTPPLDARGFVNGAFKRVFDRRFVLVYSTGGTQAENAWSFAKARFDAEQWWYRGNGFAPIMSDTEYAASPSACNVILYGNADTNKAWSTVIGGDTLRIARGEARIDGHSVGGDDLACLATVPKRGSGDYLVGVVGGTGLPGMRAVERLGYFSSGVGFPSVVLLHADAWRAGFTRVEGAGQLGAMAWKDAAGEPPAPTQEDARKTPH